jgi:hypothetical protein
MKGGPEQVFQYTPKREEYCRIIILADRNEVRSLQRFDSKWAHIELKLTFGNRFYSGYAVLIFYTAGKLNLFERLGNWWFRLGWGDNV